MASSQIEHYFHEGRKGKSGRNGPGILIIEGKYKYCVNQVNKAGDIFKMYCTKHTHPEFRCKSKAVVVARDDGSYYLATSDNIHSHLPDQALVKAEELKQRMTEIVKEKPANPVSEAIRAVKIDFAQENEDPIFLNEVLESLGGQRALEQKLLRTRNNIIGPMPKHRNDFNPTKFVKNVLKRSPMITLDSNSLKDNWREEIVSSGF